MNVASEVLATQKPAPVKPTWTCLIIAWVLFLIPLPGVGLFIGWPLNLVAFILAIVIMARGHTSKGLIPLIASIIVSPIVYFIGIAILSAAAISASNSAHQTAEQNTAAQATQLQGADAVTISSRELFAAYDANEVAADSQYKGKTLEVTGTVDRIDSDLTDDAVVQLSAGGFMKSVSAKGLPKATAASLSKGQQITVVCKGDGEIVGSPMLDECSMR